MRVNNITQQNLSSITFKGRYEENITNFPKKIPEEIVKSRPLLKQLAEMLPEYTKIKIIYNDAFHGREAFELHVGTSTSSVFGSFKQDMLKRKQLVTFACDTIASLFKKEIPKDKLAAFEKSVLRKLI